MTPNLVSKEGQLPNVEKTAWLSPSCLATIRIVHAQVLVAAVDDELHDEGSIREAWSGSEGAKPSAFAGSYKVQTSRANTNTQNTTCGVHGSSFESEDYAQQIFPHFNCVTNTEQLDGSEPECCCPLEDKSTLYQPIFDYIIEMYPHRRARISETLC